MSDENYYPGEADELSKRDRELSEFLERMFDEEDRPIFIADDACLYDIFAGVDEELSNRCENCYGRVLSREDFRIPIWKLLDSLYKELS